MIPSYKKSADNSHSYIHQILMILQIYNHKAVKPVYLVTTLLQILHIMCWWKNFENRSIFGEDMVRDKNFRLTFFGPPCMLTMLCAVAR